jgi:hypothetical protein
MTVRNVASGACLTVPGATVEVTDIHQALCTASASQRWFRVARGGGFEIRSGSTDKCLDIPGSGTADHLVVQQFECNGTDAQLFDLIRGAGGGWAIRNRNSRKCLDIPYGTSEPTSVQQYTCHGGDNQSFEFTRAQSTADDDGDGLVDEEEDDLARRFAPEVRLAPESQDRYRPANVDWFLARTKLRYDRSGDDGPDVLGPGQVTQANLATQTRGNAHSSSDSNFFLQMVDERSTSRGTGPAGWRAYVHVMRTHMRETYPGGIDIQYWFFFPFNDAWGTFNHDGDWEHVTVTVDKDRVLQTIFFAAHEDGHRFDRSALQWSEGHPVVYIAKGTHASYPSVGEWDVDESPDDDETYDGGPVWQTWRNFVNVGEQRRVLNEQTFLNYAGHWGEIGVFDITTAPNGPAFHDSRGPQGWMPWPESPERTDGIRDCPRHIPRCVQP